MPSQMGTHMIPLPPSPPQYISVNQVNQSKQQQQYDDDATQISAITDGGYIMGGRNNQASLQSHNNNRKVQNVFSKRRIERDTAVSETAPNTYANNEANTNYDMCCLGTKFIPIAYTNCTSDVYPYSDACESLENVPIVRGGYII